LQKEAVIGVRVGAEVRGGCAVAAVLEGRIARRKAEAGVVARALAARSAAVRA
jgi:hypothetical protein